MKQVILQTIENDIVVDAKRFKSITELCNELEMNQSTLCMILKNPDGKRYKNTKKLENKKIIILDHSA